MFRLIQSVAASRDVREWLCSNRNEPAEQDWSMQHRFPHSDEIADGEYACGRDELYGALREREADPIHVFAATAEDVAALELGPCPHDGVIKAYEAMTRFEFPERGFVYFSSGVRAAGSASGS